MLTILNYIAIFFVLLGTIPLWASLYQFFLIGLHGIKNHYGSTGAYLPNVAIIVPAWNEGEVIGNTIEHLLSMDYPKHALRVYVVDDASTDHTPDVVKAKHDEYPGNVFHLRREKGGQGKAHTLNHGIQVILGEKWAEAVLIIDADVLFEKETLRLMTRHLTDKTVGSVTAYIKEGSAPGNFISKFIAFEYITAQAASRRAQNVMGSLACLAGGAQLHSRENLLTIGGRIDTSSLAEDTFTTFKTQLNGRKAIFDGNAVVWAEEPGSIESLWKQRLRWARGNVQVTKAFKNIWLNKKNGKNLGSIGFSLIWFAIVLMPVFMILSSIGLIWLYFSDFSLSWTLFKQFWILNVFAYLFITIYSLIIDRQTAKKAWLQGVLFPGIISLTTIVLSCFPGTMDHFIHFVNGMQHEQLGLTAKILVLFMYAWLAICMLVAYFAYLSDKHKKPYWLSLILILISGFGPLLCAITLYSYIMEYKKAELKWDKTIKSGKVAISK